MSSRFVTLVYIIAGDEDDDVEVKQTQVSQYETMKIMTILQKSPVEADIDSATGQESGV